MRLSKSYRNPDGIRAKSFFASSLLCLLPLALNACGSDLGQRYSQGQVDSGAYGREQEVSFTSLLSKYVDSSRLVRYSVWIQNRSDVQSLESVLAAMSRADVSVMTADGRKAFYVNAYNAMTLQLILSRYASTIGEGGSSYPGQRSIRNIDRLDSKVWDQFQWKIAGRTVSLNDVENKILRPMGDARIHFAIVCASKGCPPISNRAISADQIDSDLDQLASDFVNSGRSTTINTERNEIKTSQILSWFNDDFVRSFGSVKKFFSKYVSVIDPGAVEGMKIKFSGYDWLLNESAEVSTPTPSPSSSPTPSSPPPGSGSESEIPEQG